MIGHDEKQRRDRGDSQQDEEPPPGHLQGEFTTVGLEFVLENRPGMILGLLGHLVRVKLRHIAPLLFYENAKSVITRPVVRPVKSDNVLGNRCTSVN